MINKKNVLGKTPDELGTKDAIHTAIVAVRAGLPIYPGSKCRMDEDREAVPDDKGDGVADPFRRGVILAGDSFWLLMNQDAVPNVQHVWEHPTIDFRPPTCEVQRNATIAAEAEKFGVTYEQIMEAAAYVVERNRPAKYLGNLSVDELQTANDDLSDQPWEFWGEWSAESLHEFDNCGSECCPEYEYPDCDLYEVK